MKRCRTAVSATVLAACLITAASSHAYEYLQNGVPDSETLATNGTKHYFVSLPGNGKITWTLETLSANVGDEGCRAYLFNWDWVLLYQTGNVGVGGVATITTRDLPPGGHYIIKVEGYDGGDGYESNYNGGSFRLTAAYDTVYVGDDFGDSRQVATKLKKGYDTVRGVVNADDDQDWFTFDTPDSGEVWVRLSGATDTVNLTVYDQWQNQLFTGTADAGTPDLEWYDPALIKGRCFVQVTGAAAATYGVRVDFELDPNSQETDDVSNGDNRFPLAPGIEHSFSLGSNDTDTFYVYQPYRGAFTAEVTFTHTVAGDEPIELWLEDRNGFRYALSSASAPLPVAISLAQLPAGYYRLQVKGIDGPDGYDSNFNAGIYTLKASTATGPDDVGNTPETALLKHGLAFYGHTETQSDVDMFRVFLADQGDPTESLRITVDRIQGGGVDVRVLDAAGAELGRSANPAVADEHIALGGLAKGFYTIEITGTGAAPSAYRLGTQTALINTSTLTDDVGNSRAEALPLPLNYELEGSLVTNDNDYFAFDLARAMRVEVKVTDVRPYVGDEPIQLELYNAAGTKIASSLNGAWQPQQIPFERLTGGTYYARVFGKDGDDGYDSNFNGGCFTITVVATSSFGDVSGDGTVSPYDASLILQKLAATLTLTPTQQAAADVDADGAVTQTDADLILDYSVGKITAFPAEQ